MNTIVKRTKTMGRGVFATRNFKKGQIVEVSPAVILPGEAFVKGQDSVLRFYVFETEKHKNESAVALGVGSLFNHKSDGDLTYRYDKRQNAIIFRALKPLKKGQQLFINYGYDPVDKRKRWEISKAAEQADDVKRAGPLGCDYPTDELSRAEKFHACDYGDQEVRIMADLLKKPNWFDRFCKWLTEPVYVPKDEIKGEC